METIGLTKVLQAAGGWGVAAVALIVIYRLYKDSIEKDALFSNKMEARDTEFKELLKSVCDMLGSVREIIKSCKHNRDKDRD